jgi:hypothetical protein
MTYTKLLNQTMFPTARYQGKFTPKNLVFNANLQEFAHRIGIISALQTGGKLDAIEAFAQIEALWQQLETSQKQLEIEEAEEPHLNLKHSMKVSHHQEC